MKNLKKGFTLSEVIIVLVLLGVLAFILVPMIKNIMPNDHNIKYKKAFTTIQEIVNDMANNEEICQKYNTNTGVKIENALQFCNKVAATDDDYSVPNDYSARTLNEELCKRLNTTTDVNCQSTITEITTTNGMTFTIPSNKILDSDFGVDADDENKPDEPVEITVNFGDDTNYTILIHKDGKVTAPLGVDEEKYLLDNPTE